mmetsp:Transcript_6683/g.8278  ORF Transcript_6683/g.8278 Transcript_6683/m.8278 type:complete len:252 (+) Transcript_6683:237-992(+)
MVKGISTGVEALNHSVYGLPLRVVCESQVVIPPYGPHRRHVGHVLLCYLIPVRLQPRHRGASGRCGGYFRTVHILHVGIVPHDFCGGKREGYSHRGVGAIAYGCGGHIEDRVPPCDDLVDVIYCPRVVEGLHVVVAREVIGFKPVARILFRDEIVGGGGFVRSYLHDHKTVRDMPYYAVARSRTIIVKARPLKLKSRHAVGVERLKVTVEGARGSPHHGIVVHEGRVSGHIAQLLVKDRLHICYRQIPRHR